MTHGYVSDKDALVKRLHRIEGQVRGIERMVEEERYCIDILTQIAAVSTALESLSVKLLEDHVRHCVADALAAGMRTSPRKRARTCSPPSSASRARADASGPGARCRPDMIGCDLIRSWRHRMASRVRPAI